MDTIINPNNIELPIIQSIDNIASPNKHTAKDITTTLQKPESPSENLPGGMAVTNVVTEYLAEQRCELIKANNVRNIDSSMIERTVEELMNSQDALLITDTKGGLLGAIRLQEQERYNGISIYQVGSLIKRPGYRQDIDNMSIGEYLIRKFNEKIQPAHYVYRISKNTNVIRINQESGYVRISVKQLGQDHPEFYAYIIDVRGKNFDDMGTGENAEDYTVLVNKSLCNLLGLSTEANTITQPGGNTYPSHPQYSS